MREKEKERVEKNLEKSKSEECQGLKGKKNRTKLKGKEGYYTYLIAWDVLLCPEQLVAALYQRKRGPLLSISLLLAPHKGVRVEISHTSMLPP